MSLAPGTSAALAVATFDRPPNELAGLHAELLTTVESYQHLDDPGHVLFALAVATSMQGVGDPLWGMLVGAPSSGKTETIRALDGLGEHVDELTAPSLLSWQTKKGKWLPTGVLLRVPDPGLLTIGDFSTVLSTSDRGGRDQLFALLRRVYDGSVVRDVGNAPGPLRWQGRLTIVAAVTPAIDHYSSHADTLGPRWLYYRLDPKQTGGKRATARMARFTGDQLEERRDRARKLAAELVDAARERLAYVELSEEFGVCLDDAAIVACYLRAAVPRNGYGRREIEGLAVVEEPPRLVRQLLQLGRGLVALGLDEDDALTMCRRAALDSVPQARLRVLRALVAEEELTTSQVARRIGGHRHVARMALEELAVIGDGLVRCLVDDDDEEAWEPGQRFPTPRPWRLDGPDARLIAEVVSAPLSLARSVGTHPPTTPQDQGETDR